jgi:hypothetical protein
VTEAEVIAIVHRELTARGIVAGPIDDFLLAKARVLASTVTSPDRLTAAVIASGLELDSVAAMHVGDALSAYFRRMLKPILE